MTTREDEPANRGIPDDIPHWIALLARGENAAVLRAIAGGARNLRDLRQTTGLATDEDSLPSVLRALTRCGAARRSVDPGPPLHVQYRLTGAGEELLGIVSAAALWLDRWGGERNR